MRNYQVKNKCLLRLTRSCPAYFGLLHPHLFLDTKGLLVVLGERDSTKVPGNDPLCWELICSKFSNIFQKPALPLREP